MTTTTKDRDWVEEVGEPAYAVIKEMVDALQVDWQRLAELRELRDDVSEDQGMEGWQTQCPREAHELADLEEKAGDCEDEDDARRRIDEDVLSLRVFGERIEGEWKATNYELLLSTGGPAVRIVGGLADGEAASARLEVQDWFKPWTEYPTNDDVLMSYAGCFYFG
jgi:hypothetical protein